jgi:hypothetical protein
MKLPIAATRHRRLHGFFRGQLVLSSSLPPQVRERTNGQIECASCCHRQALRRLSNPEEIVADAYWMSDGLLSNAA